MRVGLDCRLAGKQHAGIGRYIENLIIRLPKLPSDLEFVYFFHNQEQQQQVSKEFSHDDQSAPLQIVYAPIRHYSLKEQLQLPVMLRNYQLDLLHVPHFNVPLLYHHPFLVTIHDLLWHQQKGPAATTLPSWQYWLKYIGYRYVTRNSIFKAFKILVPAQTIKKVIVGYFPQVETKIVVTKEGIAEEFIKAGQAKKISSSAVPRDKQLIYVGSLYPHKNVNLVISALKVLPEYKLIIVGTRNIFQQRLKKLLRKLDVESQVIFKGYLTDKELVMEFNQSVALVQPSFSEGFGLTGVEAMATGLPVIASDIPIFREIYQDAALYFNPYQISSFLNVVRGLDNKTRKFHSQRGLKLSQDYRWSNTTAQTLQVYQDILNSTDQKTN